MDTSARRMSPVEKLAERADDLGRQALRLRALSRTQPHVFLEDKQELAKAVFELAEEMRKLGRRPARTSEFRSGEAVIRDRAVVVEVRRRTTPAVRGAH